MIWRTFKLIRSAVATATNPRAMGYLGCLLALCLALAPQARAASITFSSLQFTIVNTNGDGTGALANGGLSLVLTGPNNGGGLPGTTDLLAIAPADGMVSFDYLYSSQDTPGYDMGGYVVQGVFTELADTDMESGSASFSVTSGESFGFRVATVDNEGEPGIFTVSNFDAPGAATPEPGTMLLMLGGLILINTIERNRRRRSRLVLADAVDKSAVQVSQ